MQRALVTARAVVPRAVPAVPVVPTIRMASTASASSGSLAYNLVFKRNVTYITYIVAGAVLLELVYGKVTDGVWDSLNKGKTFDSIDWSKWKTEDDEE